MESYQLIFALNSKKHKPRHSYLYSHIVARHENVCGVYKIYGKKYKTFSVRETCRALDC